MEMTESLEPPYGESWWPEVDSLHWIGSAPEEATDPGSITAESPAD